MIELVVNIGQIGIHIIISVHVVQIECIKIIDRIANGLLYIRPLKDIMNTNIVLYLSH